MSKNARTAGGQCRRGDAIRRVIMCLLYILLASLAACATVPTGPSLMSLPGTGKSFDQFRIDDAVCRQFAYEQTGGTTAQQAGQKAAISSAALGTALGAVAGAAIGSATGDMGSGAAIGAGSGLILGSAAGSSYASGSYYEAQRRYDNAYLQCMYAKGNRVPVYRRGSEQAFVASARSATPPPANFPPPPPPPSLAKPTAKIVDKMTLRVNFNVDQAIIRSGDKADLDRVAGFVKKYPNAKIELDGYTDDRGTEAHNRRLSEKRAQAVKQYLIEEAGVDPSRISAIGRGELDPVADNKTAKGRFENRRVEILILQE
jgi:outer membrane protein OmpA-like peptidoglycan-associated protein